MNVKNEMQRIVKNLAVPFLYIFMPLPIYLHLVSDLQPCEGHWCNLSGNWLHGHSEHQLHGEKDSGESVSPCTFQFWSLPFILNTVHYVYVKINTTSDERDRSNPFRFANIGVEKFLELNSEQNHDDYCLAYVFTDRDFDDGVLGLAWVGAPSGKLQQDFLKYLLSVWRLY